MEPYSGPYTPFIHDSQQIKKNRNPVPFLALFFVHLRSFSKHF